MRCNWLYGCTYITYSARSLSQPHSVRYSIYSAYSVYAVYSHTAYTLYIHPHSYNKYPYTTLDVRYVSTVSRLTWAGYTCISLYPQKLTSF